MADDKTPDPFGPLPEAPKEKMSNAELVGHHYLHITNMHNMINDVRKSGSDAETDGILEQILIIQDLMGKAHDNS